MKQSSSISKRAIRLLLPNLMTFSSLFTPANAANVESVTTSRQNSIEQSTPHSKNIQNRFTAPSNPNSPFYILGYTEISLLNEAERTQYLNSLAKIFARLESAENKPEQNREQFSSLDYLLKQLASAIPTAFADDTSSQQAKTCDPWDLLWKGRSTSQGKLDDGKYDDKVCEEFKKKNAGILKDANRDGDTCGIGGIATTRPITTNEDGTKSRGACPSTGRLCIGADGIKPIARKSADFRAGSGCAEGSLSLECPRSQQSSDYTLCNPAFSGVQKIGKKTFGICVPVSRGDDSNTDSTNACSNAGNGSTEKNLKGHFISPAKWIGSEDVGPRKWQAISKKFAGDLKKVCDKNNIKVLAANCSFCAGAIRGLQKANQRSIDALKLRENRRSVPHSNHLTSFISPPEAYYPRANPTPAPTHSGGSPATAPATPPQVGGFFARFRETCREAFLQIATNPRVINASFKVGQAAGAVHEAVEPVVTPIGKAVSLAVDAAREAAASANHAFSEDINSCSEIDQQVAGFGYFNDLAGKLEDFEAHCTPYYDYDYDCRKLKEDLEFSGCDAVDSPQTSSTSENSKAAPATHQ